MKRTTQLLVMSVLMFGVQHAALAEPAESPFPADSSEEAYNLPAIESYAERQARMGEGAPSWGVSKRAVQPHDPFPFGGGYIDN